MKGILKLIPLKEPKEGMKAIYKDKIFILGENVGFGFTDTEKELIETSNLQQIVVEYHKDTFTQRDGILPISEGDYEKALPFIGKEVEWNEAHDLDTGWYGAVLIESTPEIHIEELRDKIQLAISKQENKYPTPYARTSDNKENLHIWMIDTRKESESVVELLKELKLI